MPGPSKGALAGLKVIDLTRVLGGPYCTMVLSDHGAEVIKIEPPQGDEVRDWGPPFHDHEEGGRDASYFIGVNRNKKSLALDLARPEAREVLLRLLDGADVIIENFAPGVMPRLGLGYGELSRLNPRLIMASLSATGATGGPWNDLVTYGPSLAALYGVKSLLGYHDDPKPREDTADLDPTAADSIRRNESRRSRGRRLRGRGDLRGSRSQARALRTARSADAAGRDPVIEHVLDIDHGAGRGHEPARLHAVLRTVAALRGQSEEAVAEATFANAEALFG